jgi:uncharacterized protein YjdB
MLRKRALLLFMAFLIACLTLPAAVGGAGVNSGLSPQIQKSVYNDGVTAAPAPLNNPAAAWTQTVENGSVAGISVKPLVAGDSVFVLDNNGKVLAFDAGTGVQKWASQLSFTGKKLQLASPSYDSGRLYVATNDGHVCALDAAGGKVLWDTALPLVSETSQLSTTVKCAGGKLYVGAWNSDVKSDEYYYCLDAATGKPGIGQIYQAPNTAAPGGYFWAGACVAERCLIFGSERSVLTCLDKDSGQLLNSVDLKDIVPEAKEIRSSISCDPSAGMIFLTDQARNDGSCWAFGLDPATGKITYKWRTRLGFSTSTPVACNGRLYVGTGMYSMRGGLYCLEESTGKEIWKFMAPGETPGSVPGVQASPVVSVQNGAPYIYFPTIWENSSVFCLEQNGSPLWEFKDQTSFIHQGVAVSAEGWLYFGGDNGLHALKPVSAAPVTGVVLDKTSVTLTVGAVAPLTANVVPAGAGNRRVAWASGDTAVVTVDQEGKVTAMAPGSADITVTTSEGGFAAACAVTVQEPAVLVTGVVLDKNSITIEAGASDTLIATVSPADADNRRVVWISGDNAVATVDQDGKVTAVTPGRANITVTTSEGGFAAGCLVEVSERAPKMITVHMKVKTQDGKTLFEHDVSVAQGQTVMDVLFAAAQIDPAVDPKVDWDSLYITGGYAWSICGLASPWGERSDGWIYFVNDVMPNVGAAIYGKAKYKLLNDGDKILWRWSWMSPVTAVALNKSALTIRQGQSESLSALITPAHPNNGDVVWSSSDPKVAMVDSKGKVTVVGSGAATITATTVDGGFTAACVVNGPPPESDAQVVVRTGDGAQQNGAENAPEKELPPEKQPPQGGLARLLPKVAVAAEPAPASAPSNLASSQSLRAYEMTAANNMPLQLRIKKSKVNAYAAAIFLAVFLSGASRRYHAYKREVVK